MSAMPAPGGRFGDPRERLLLLGRREFALLANAIPFPRRFGFRYAVEGPRAEIFNVAANASRLDRQGAEDLCGLAEPIWKELGFRSIVVLDARGERFTFPVA